MGTPGTQGTVNFLPSRVKIENLQHCGEPTFKNSAHVVQRKRPNRSDRPLGDHGGGTTYTLRTGNRKAGLLSNEQVAVGGQFPPRAFFGRRRVRSYKTPRAYLLTSILVPRAEYSTSDRSRTTSVDYKSPDSQSPYISTIGPRTSTS